MITEENPILTPMPTQGTNGRRARFLVRHDRDIAVVRATDVDWLAAAGNYVILHVGSATHMVRESLLALEAGLDPSRFVRVSRAAMVNLDSVKAIVSPRPGDSRLILNDGTELPVTRGIREIQARLEFG